MLLRFPLLVYIILISFCNNNNEVTKNGQNHFINKTENYQLNLQKVRSIRINSGSEIIGKLESPLIVYKNNDSKKYLIRDTGLNQIVVLDTEGNVVQLIGSAGDGPSEFRRLSAFGLNSDKLYVYDNTLDLIKIFDLNGTLINSFYGLLNDDIWNRSRRIYGYNDKIVFGVQEAGFASENNHWLSKTIALYDTTGTISHLMGEYDPSLEGSGILYNYVNITVDEKNEVVYTTHRTSPFIQSFNIKSGKQLTRFGRITDNFLISDERPKVNDSRQVKNSINVKYSFVGDSYVTENYFYFMFFNFTKEAYDLRDQSLNKYFMQVFDKAGKYYGDITLPFYPLGIDGDQILLLENDNPDDLTIGVYEYDL